MGYAMFNMREMTLRSCIADIQFMITSLSMKQQQLAWVSSIFGMAGANMNNQQVQKNQYNLYVVNQQEKMITLQMKRLETQLQAKQKELEGVEKAKQNEIKQSAPRFGLG